MTINASGIRQTILDLLSQRGPDKTICPSEVARACGDEDWRDLMDEVRDVAATLVREGTIRVPQKGETVDIATARGPVRFARV